MVVDCTDEFLIRKSVNYVQRIVNQQGYSNRVKVTLEYSESSPLGVNVVMIDTETNMTKPIEMDLLISKIQA